MGFDEDELHFPSVVGCGWASLSCDRHLYESTSAFRSSEMAQEPPSHSILFLSLTETTSIEGACPGVTRFEEGSRQKPVLTSRLVSAHKTKERFGMTRVQAKYFFYTVAVDTIGILFCPSPSLVP